VRRVIEPMASDGLRTICLAYKDYVKGKLQLRRHTVVIGGDRNRRRSVRRRWTCTQRTRLDSRYHP